MEELEYRFYKALVAWIAVVVLTIIVTITVYNVADRIGPVKPYMHQEYSWPAGVPSR